MRGRHLGLIQPDDVITVLKLLADRSQQLVEQRIAAVNRPHQLLQELLPGGASRRLTAAKSREILSSVRPRDQVGTARKQLALEHVADVADLDARLNRGGNRRLNFTLHVAALVQSSRPAPDRDYYLRKRAAGTSPLEAMRCLKRRLSDVVFRALLADLERREGAGPVGHSGRLLHPARLTQPRWSALRISHNQDPPRRTLRPHERAEKAPH